MAKTGQSQISMPVIKRLPRYNRYLSALIEQDVSRISSGQLAKAMSLTASQIRQDLNCFGGFGQQGYGYNVKELQGEIESILKLGQIKKAILIGAGNLGHTIATHVDLHKCGFDLCGIFDKSPPMNGSKINGLEIISSDLLLDFIPKNQVEMAILCIPGDGALPLVKSMIEVGVKGIWNFSQDDLIIEDHPNVYIENIRLVDSLMTLRYHI